MIETKEQYRRHLKIMAVGKCNHVEDVCVSISQNALVQTIEALREVARDVVWIKVGGITGNKTTWYICHLCNEADTDGPVHEEHCPMYPVPDWITNG